MASKLKQITSPAGVAFFPKLNTPDTKFNAAGEYSVKLILDPSNPEHADFIDKVKELDEEAFKAALAEAKTPKAKKGIKRQYVPWTEHLDKDGEDTGLIEIKFKTKASFVNKQTGKSVSISINFFDAKGKPIKDVPEIWSGTVMKVNASIAPYCEAAIGCGITLRINAVQIIALTGPGQGGGNASAYGFGEEEGYEAVDKPVSDESFDEVDEDTEEDEIDGPGDF